MSACSSGLILVLDKDTVQILITVSVYHAMCPFFTNVLINLLVGVCYSSNLFSFLKIARCPIKSQE